MTTDRIAQPSPSTLQPMGGISDKADRIQGQEPAKRTLSELGYKPAHERVDGAWKINCFHVANALTFGVVGFFAGWASESEYMGTQKGGESNNKFVRWCNNVAQKSIEDLGQTYLNATLGHNVGREDERNPHIRADDHTFLRVATKVWSTGLGGLIMSAASLGALGGARALYAHAHHQRARNEFNDRFTTDFGQPSAPNTMSFGLTGTGARLAGMANGEMHKKAQAEAEAIFLAKKEKADRIAADPDTAEVPDNTQALSAHDYLSGSANLRSVFAANLASEYSLENMFFLDCVENATRNIVPAPDDNDGNMKTLLATGGHLDAETGNWEPGYKLNKWEVAMADSKMQSDSADYQINVSYTSRSEWRQNMTDVGLADFRTRWNAEVNTIKSAKLEIADAERRLSNEAQPLSGTQIDAQKQRISDAEQRISDCQDRLDTMKTEEFTPEQSQAIGSSMSTCHEQIYSLMNDSATRFNTEMLKNVKYNVVE